MSVILVFLLASCVTKASNSNAPASLYTSYMTSNPGKGLNEFASDFISSFYQDTPSMDGLLGKGLPELKSKRNEFKEKCPNVDPLTMPWVQKQIVKIVGEGTVATNKTLLKLWEVFRLLPCPSKIGYKPEVFLSTFGATYGVDVYETLKLYWIGDEICLEFDSLLSQAFKEMGCNVKALTDPEKIFLVIDATNSGYIDATLEVKKEMIRERRDKAEFDDRIMGKFKVKQKAQRKGLFDFLTETFFGTGDH
jgi:hypothetical protein